VAWRLLNWAASLVLMIVVLAAAGCVYMFPRALRAYSGVKKLFGLSDEVRVFRDGYGAPHIFAGSMDDAARARLRPPRASGY
jgi:penicillin G amidase